MTFWKRLWNYFRVKSAIKNAQKLHKVTKKQYYVIKIHDKIRVYDRNRINLLIQHGVLSRRLKDAIELRKYCIYYTK